MLTRYILKRILIFIPTLFAISLVVFLLDKNMPGDPVLRCFDDKNKLDNNIYEDRWKLFNLNYPTFYLSFASQAAPDTLHNIPEKNLREVLSQLVNQTGNWETTQAYFQALQQMQLAIENTSSDSTNAKKFITIKVATSDLFNLHESEKIKAKLALINTSLQSSTLTNLQQPAKTLTTAYQTFQDEPTTWKKYIPAIQWHGISNQYHIWIFGNKPWIERTKNLLNVGSKPLTATAENYTFTAPKEGYYRITPNINLSENNGELSTKEISSKRLFHIEINAKSKDYSPKNLEEEEFLVPAKAGETVTISMNIKPLAKNYQLKYSYDLQAVQLLNHHPDKLSKGFIRFDFGKNCQLKPVGKMIGDAIFWTILMSTLSILLTYLISIPIGVYSARNKGTKKDDILSTFLFMLYSLPNFWVATLLILLLGQTLGWFPIFGLGDVQEGATALQTFQIRAYHLILPLFCWTYPSLAFLSRQMRGGMLSTLNKDFIRTARAKGLEENTVIWKHGFRNSLLPIITIFANVFPRMVSGSIVIEVIFGIPGMGRLLLDSINGNDFPIIFAIVMLTAILTMVGYLVADILYAIVNPRIKY